MSHSGLDDYVAQGLCNMCYTQLDYKQGCPDCDDKCQQCGVYLWEYDEQTWKLIDDEPMCQDCWTACPEAGDRAGSNKGEDNGS